jgi:Tol biopolymer transport system component
MSSLKTRPSNRPRPEGSRQGRGVVAVRVPSLPPANGDFPDRSAVDWLREQEALIEEARLRARRRRQRYGALALLGVTVAVAVALIRVSGGDPKDISPALGRFVPSAAPATNGKIAFADIKGRLHVVALDTSRSEVTVDCRAWQSPDQRPKSTLWQRTACELIEPAWSPDGRQIAFFEGSMALPRDATSIDSLRGEFSLYLKDSGGSIRHLAGCGSCARQQSGGHLSWSPDGSWIAFSRESEVPRWTHSLWAVNTASGELRRLTGCQSCVDVNPDWSPNGQSIVFSRFDKQGPGLYTVRADGSQLTKITSSDLAAHPQWSPNGRKIAFDARDKIFTIDADGSNQKVLLNGRSGSGPATPSWSPDGTKLAYFNTPGAPSNFTAEVWTMNTNGSQKHRLYHSACCLSRWASPIWSPDGTKIAFAATSAHGTNVINSDGTHLRRLGTTANGLTWQQFH